MNVTVKMRNCKRKRLIEELVAFSIAALNIGNSRKTLTIYSSKEFRKLLNGGYGFVQPDPNDQNNIILVVDANMSYRKLIVVLSHEMHHVMQNAKGKLRQELNRQEYDNVWCGKKFTGAYEDAPWEWQAWEWQYDLALAFTKSYL